MMAALPPSSSSLLPLLDSLEDEAAGQSEQTDAYLTIANRLSGEDGRLFLPVVVKHFSRLGKAFQTHISSENAELGQAALQALGFCVFSPQLVSGIPAKFSEEILSALAALVVKSTDKNICTRALWVISKQNFPSEVVAKKTPEILKTLESVRTREDIQSIIMEHEALNVVIKMLEQAPAQMCEGSVRWAELVIPLVVHSASKVRLRAAAALEMGMPLLLEKQQDVAAIIEPMMSSKLIPELQKLFSSKNESNVLKLWPLFVRLLGKVLHRGGSFINSLLYLEELGFRSSSPSIKKIAFIAWKSLIDNFALNPDILCSTKRLKLLMQPLSSIQVRTEALLLTKLEVWWYLVVKLGPNLLVNFEQVGVPLLHSTLPTDSPVQSPATPARGSNQSNGIGPVTPKSGVPSCSSPGTTPRMNLSSSVHAAQAYPSIQLLGLEMLLHYFLGSEVTAAAAKNRLTLSLEPLTQPLLSSPSSFTKHSSILISAVRDGFIAIGKDAPDALLSLIWKSLVGFVSTAIEAAGNKKERPGSEVLTLLLQALQSILSAEALPASQALVLLEATVKGIPRKVLGSAAYQVANMDVLNGTPALFLILLFYNNSLLSSFVADERFFLCLETLVSCGLSGPTSPLAFGEAVLGTMGRSVGALENKEQLWRMWSVVVNPLTDTITRTNEVNQGDALEHNFNAIHSALMFPITHLLPGKALPQMTQKSLLGTWSRLYDAFARCSALVPTAEENVCCEELCIKMAAALDSQALSSLLTLEAVANILQIIIESVDFSPYTPQFQQKMKSPHTPLGWVRRKSKALRNLSTFHTLLVQSLEAFLALDPPETSAVGLGTVVGGLGTVLISILSTLFTNLALTTVIQEALTSLTQPLALLYGQAGSTENEQSKSYSSLGPKLEKLLVEMLGCLQTRSALQYDDELLALLSPLLCVLFPHKSKQVRTLVTQFWNATFGNALVLTYPEELTPVLNQVKQKTPIILPGFQAVEVSDELSGQYSSECSQMEMEISGVKVTSVGKRGSLLARAGELKEKSSGTPSKPVSVKLDFGSPKPPRREVLEEEASIDFVFIPPETKERVLTEHQKEVKRTKRVDIPAMYNNLDASLDTTAFSQYTQSQEDSTDKLPTDEQAEANEKDKIEVEVREENMETEEASVINVKETQDCISPKANVADRLTEKKDPSADSPMEDVSGQEDSAAGTREDTSPNVSGSSDMISGTPQKANSRRQSFITLEKYAGGTPASPINVTGFTGPLTRTSDSQETPKSLPSTPAAPVGSQTENGKGASQETPKDGIMPQSSQQKMGENQKELKAELKLSGKRLSEGTEDEDDVIPDTQTPIPSGVSDAVVKPVAKESAVPVVELEKNSLDEESEVVITDSQNLQLSSPSELRRSVRRRSRPVRPGEDTEEQDTESPKSTPSPAAQTDSQSRGRPGRKSKLAEVEKADNRLRRKGIQRDHEQSQTDSQLATSSPATPMSTQSQGISTRARSKDLSQTELPSNTQSSLAQTDSQSQGRPGRRSKLVSDVEESVKDKRKGSVVEEEQRDSQIDVPSDGSQKDEELHALLPETDLDGQSQGRPRRSTRSEAESQDREKPSMGDQKLKEMNKSQTLTPSISIKGRLGQRRKILLQEDSKSYRNSSPTVSTDSDCSQVEGTQKSSQGPGRYKTRRSSQGLLASVENSESDSSETRGDGQKPKKRGRKPRSLTSQLTPSPLTIEQVPVNKVGAEMVGADAPLEVAMEVLKPPQKTEPESSLEVYTANESAQFWTRKAVDKDVLTTKDPVVLKSTLETKPDGEQSENETKMDVECNEVEIEGEGTKPSSQNGPTKPDGLELPNQPVHRCPHAKRGRGRRQSRGCNCLISAISQEGDYSDSQLIQENDQTSLDHNRLPSDSEPATSMSDAVPLEKENTVTDDHLVPEANTLSTPTLANSPSTETLPPESPVDKLSLIVCQSSDEKEGPPLSMPEPEDKLSQIVPQSSEEKEGPAVAMPEPEDMSSKEVLEEQVVAKDEGQQECVSAIEQEQLDEKLEEDTSAMQEPLEPSSVQQEEGVEEKSARQEQQEEETSLLEQPVSSNVQQEDVAETSARQEQPEEETSTIPQQPESSNVQQEEDVEETSAQQEQPEEETSTIPQQPESSNVQQEEDVEETSARQEQPEEETSTIPQQPESSNVQQEEDVEETSTRQEQPEEETSTIPEQPESSHVQQEEVVEDLSSREREEAMEAQEEQDLEPSINGVGVARLSEEPKVEDEDTQMDNNLPVDAADSAADLISSNEPSAPLQTAPKDLCLDSPLKQNNLDYMGGEPEVGQSPSSGRTRGIWSPSASPSTSILKKGQKRPFEEESPSPLLKSRRVSFADPIYHQELADDIDRRSPVVRTSSPRSKTISAQPKYITTPTKGLLTLTPRNLRSPGYKSSKKCLISEMSHEPRPIPKDCVYPALVCCSAPVEAVLPQISSNVWPRGFGQLVRARNIKTVGDLSALTSNEIKLLPIRSPKLSNVKKALKTYHEQQRKGRDDLKGFDEMEKMTSEPEEVELPENQEEEKTGEAQDAVFSDVPTAVEQRPEELLSEVEALGARLTPEELGRCSPGQLVQMHEHLGGMMRSIVVQLQTRVIDTPADGMP